MKDLGELEAEVMARLWDWDRTCTVRDILEDLAPDRQLAYTTVMTVLDNLHKKGFVTRQAVGRAYHYQSVQSREEHTADLIPIALARSDDRPASLLRFVERLDPEEQAALRASLERLPEQRPRHGRS